MTKTERIAHLNDVFRSTFIGGRVVLTEGIRALSESDRAEVITKVRTLADFTEDNDPHREHDFGAFEHEEQRFFWKIDYYDRDMTFGSEDPADPKATTRVLTIMLAEEY